MAFIETKCNSQKKTFTNYKNIAAYSLQLFFIIVIIMSVEFNEIKIYKCIFNTSTINRTDKNFDRHNLNFFHIFVVVSFINQCAIILMICFYFFK